MNGISVGEARRRNHVRGAPSGSLQPVFDSLDRHHPLTMADRAALDALPLRITAVGAHRFLVRERDRPEQCCLLLDGYACRHKLAANGQRQIVSFHMPGEMLDAQHLELACADHNVQTITAATIAWVPRDDVRRLIEGCPNLRRAVLRAALVEASIFREWILNVGRREAIARVGHLLCEFATRREAAGLGRPDHFELPMSQEHIADATGLTAVHVNRMLQSLGTLGMIERHRRDVRISNWQDLRKLSDFDPAYLHLARAKLAQSTAARPRPGAAVPAPQDAR